MGLCESSSNEKRYLNDKKKTIDTEEIKNEHIQKFESNERPCSKCNKLMNINDLILEDSEYLCKDCEDKCYEFCVKCMKSFRKGSFYQGYRLCESCQKREDDEEYFQHYLEEEERRREEDSNDGGS